MAHFFPCPECGRHLRSGEPSCPFCGFGKTDAMHVTSPLPGALSVMLVGLCLAGCVDKIRPGEKYGGPPPRDDIETIDKAEPAEPVEQDQDVIQNTDDGSSIEDDETRVAPKYGAPPLAQPAPTPAPE
ncbi:MAG: hypothetical protein KC431_18090 [Myxococcales bacterium]|nr:hypothetical protein [Myxococcales bacterium]